MKYARKRKPRWNYSENGIEELNATIHLNRCDSVNAERKRESERASEWTMWIASHEQVQKNINTTMTPSLSFRTLLLYKFMPP